MIRYTAAILCSLALFLSDAAGGTYTMKPGAADWESPDSYDNGGERPYAGDTVTIPAGVTARVDNDSVAFVSSLGKVFMSAKTSALEIDISTNATLGCQLTAMSDVSKEQCGTGIGTVTKRGTGELYLAVGATSADYKSQYYVNWDIEGGAIRMPTNSASATSQLYFGAITVNEGATLYTANPGRTRIAELWGSGLVTNVSQSTTYYLDVYGFTDSGRTRPCEFSGALGGGICLYSRGNVNFTGTNNTFFGDCWVWNYNNSQTYGTTGLKKLGMAGEPSSAGAGSKFRTREYSGRFLYLGSGETTDRTFQFDQSSNRPAEFDAGAVGGITFTGKWQDNPNNTDINRIVITGSNTAECVLANAFDYNCGYRLTKKGTGTWRLADNADRKMKGVVAVQDGTLKFDSIAPAGTVCSLGLSTVLYEDYTGAKSDDRKVNYALAIGGNSSKTGTLEYAGIDAAFCTNRPMMVSGAGRFRASGGELTFGGVFAGNDGGTLIYDAANGETNTLADVADGEYGALSIVKEGNGTLRLVAGQTWSGSLDVIEGKVLVDSRYDYWRLTMKENAYACSRYDTSSGETGDATKILHVSEFALYDKGGARLTEGIANVGDSTSNVRWIKNFPVANLNPGETAIENGGAFMYWLGNGAGHLGSLFDGTTSYANANCIVMYHSSGKPQLDVPARQPRIILRLSEDADEVAYYDIATGYGTSTSTYYGRSLTAYSLEGSADGIFWEKIAEDNAAEVPKSSGGWYSGGDKFAINRTTPLTNVSSVRVSPGAALVANGPVGTIRKLVLDTTGAGTIDGFEFAADGVLEINGNFGGAVAIPLAIRNSRTLANIADWSVVSDGKARKWSVMATASGVTVSKAGMFLIIR
jgi:autotransporter-associated beta strand protein